MKYLVILILVLFVLCMLAIAPAYMNYRHTLNECSDSVSNGWCITQYGAIEYSGGAPVTFATGMTIQLGGD